MGGVEWVEGWYRRLDGVIEIRVAIVEWVLGGATKCPWLALLVRWG